QERLQVVDELIVTFFNSPPAAGLHLGRFLCFDSVCGQGTESIDNAVDGLALKHRLFVPLQWLEVGFDALPALIQQSELAQDAGTEAIDSAHYGPWQFFGESGPVGLFTRVARG